MNIINFTPSEKNIIYDALSKYADDMEIQAKISYSISINGHNNLMRLAVKCRYLRRYFKEWGDE